MDDSHTSTRLRSAAVKAIQEAGRPIAAHELETWVTNNDKDLWKEVSKKCYDYVRIILSLTAKTIITKYKTDAIIPGVDKRAAFYGLTDETYDSTLWTPASEMTANACGIKILMEQPLVEGARM